MSILGSALVLCLGTQAHYGSVLMGCMCIAGSTPLMFLGGGGGGCMCNTGSALVLCISIMGNTL